MRFVFKLNSLRETVPKHRKTSVAILLTTVTGAETAVNPPTYGNETLYLRHCTRPRSYFNLLNMSGVREQDRYLPIANISRIMKKSLPANAKIAKDAKETVQECVSEFISFITSEYVSQCSPGFL